MLDVRVDGFTPELRSAIRRAVKAQSRPSAEVRIVKVDDQGVTVCVATPMTLSARDWTQVADEQHVGRKLYCYHSALYDARIQPHQLARRVGLLVGELLSQRP